MNAPTELAADAPVLLRERDDDVAILVLNRPEARNSLSEAMLVALSDNLSEIAADRTVRAVVLAANGPGFCAGHDLKELTGRRGDADGGRAYFRQIMTLCSAMMQQIVNLPQPMIAAVQGVATAAGCSTGGELRSGDCLHRRHVRHAWCRHRLVLFDANGCTLPQCCTQACHGDAADGRCRIRGRCLPHWTHQPRGEALERNARKRSTFAHKIAGKSSHIVKIGKEGFYRQAEMSLSDAYRYVSEVMVENLMARDAEEGLNALHRQA